MARAAPTGACPLYLDGETADGEAAGSPDGGEVRHLLHVAIADFDACEMGLPDDLRVFRPLELLSDEWKGPVQLQASVPTTFTPFSRRKSVLSRSMPAP